jgi:hypothetical protein
MASATRITPRKAQLDGIASKPVRARTRYTPRDRPMQRVRAHGMIRLGTRGERGTTWGGG